MISSFKSQLDSVSLFQETEPESADANSEDIKMLRADIEKEYALIKAKMLEMAKNGEYIFNNGQKEILLDYKSEVLDSLITMTHRLTRVNQTLRNPTGDFLNEVAYQINEQKKYDFLINVLEELSAEDNIAMVPIVFKCDKRYADKEFYEVPCAI